MLTLLNLLPDEKKTALQKRVRSRFLLWQVVLILLLEIFYASFLFGTSIVLSSQKKVLMESDAQYIKVSNSQEGTLDQYESKFRGTNEAIEVIGRIDRGHFRFENIFYLLEELLPQGVTIEELRTEGYTVLLIGRAENREDLLVLDERLKQSACLEKVNVPISNLFSQTEVEFQLDFAIKSECLHQTL